MSLARATLRDDRYSTQVLAIVIVLYNEARHPPTYAPMHLHTVCSHYLAWSSCCMLLLLLLLLHATAASAAATFRSFSHPAGFLRNPKFESSQLLYG
ncbi:hypothetical protein BZA05DRAFT_437836, partial [Tricharina praecox]|uniref:uncharacterized protein n=1 Tax=Tricharina praecox TaxID=43433 RepID=UPI00222013FC